MSLARFFDRIAALLILAMGSSVTAAFVAVTG